MLKAIRSLFGAPRPAGEPRMLRRLTTADSLIAVDGVHVDEDGWRIDVQDPVAVRLFEVPISDAGKCMLTFRAQMKSKSLMKGAYLEMWCRLPGAGEFFSRGLNNKVRGTTNWASYETPFLLREGQQPDLVKLNIVSEGPGTVWIKDIELLSTPLA